MKPWLPGAHWFGSSRIRSITVCILPGRKWRFRRESRDHTAICRFRASLCSISPACICCLLLFPCIHSDTLVLERKIKEIFSFLYFKIETHMSAKAALRRMCLFLPDRKLNNWNIWLRPTQLSLVPHLPTSLSFAWVPAPLGCYPRAEAVACCLVPGWDVTVASLSGTLLNALQTFSCKSLN